MDSAIVLVFSIRDLRILVALALTLKSTASKLIANSEYRQ